LAIAVRRGLRSRTASITAGFGDLASDRYNALANVELFKRDGVVWRDVVDSINPIYGQKFSTVRDGSGQMFGNRGAPSSFSYPGSLIGVGAVPGCTSVNAAGLCQYDRFARFEVQPKADRDKLEGFGEVLYSRAKTEYISAFNTYGSTNPDAT
jgi:iron complex outermembrane receptor protein